MVWSRALALSAVMLALLGVPGYSAPPSSDRLGSPLSFRGFVHGTNYWQVSRQDVIVYSSATGSVRRQLIEGLEPGDTINDVIESDGQLWLVTNRTLCSVDLSASTAATVPFVHDPVARGKLAADIDYIWLSSADTLWRLDRLAREWTGFALPDGPASARTPVGCASVGDRVFCLYTNGLFVFSTSDEKWRIFPIEGGSLSNVAFFVNDVDALVILDGNRLLQFRHDSQQWRQVTLPGAVVDFDWDESAFYLLTGKAAFSLTKANWFLRQLPVSLEVPSLVVKSNDSTLAILDAGRTVFFTLTNQSSDYMALPGDRADVSRVKSATLERTVLYRCEDGLDLYDADTRLWRFLRLGSTIRRKTFIWNEDECRLSYAPDWESSLHGEVGVRVAATAAREPDSALFKGYAYDTVYVSDTTTNTIDTMVIRRNVYDSTTVLRPKKPSFPTNLTLHTKMGKGRYLDAYFDNTSISAVARKGVVYQGASNDVVAGVQLLSNTFDAGKSQLLPRVGFEGASADVQSPRKLAGRDRRIVAASGGYGTITSQIRYRHLTFNQSGRYLIDDAISADTGDIPVAIAPGTFRVWVDGDEVSKDEYSFSATTGDLFFSRRDLIDNTSSILVSYQVKTRPDSGFATIELLPENNFGSLGFARTTVSPLSWLSVQAGYLYGRDSLRRDLVSGALPLELRRSRPELLLLCTPEFSMNTADQSKAGALSLDGRIGKKFSFAGNALLADSSYRSTETLSRGLGFLRRELGGTLAYDMLPELPISYRYSSRTSELGSESVQRVSAGAHFAHFPMLDVEFTRTALSARDSVDTSATPASTASDSTRIGKDKIRLRFYETESEGLRRLIRAHQIGYEVSYSRYAFTDSVAGITGGGSSWYGLLNYTPIKSCALTTVGTLVENGLSTQRYLALDLQTVDLVKGMELGGKYTFDQLYRYSADSSSYNQVRSASLVLRPGTWIKFLRWITPRGGISQNPSFVGAGDLSVQEMLMARGSKFSTTFLRSVGAHVAAGSTVLYRNENTWATADSFKSFATFNDVKIWPRDGMLWQTRYELLAKDTIDKHTTWTRLDQRWNRLMQTMTQIDWALTQTTHTSTHVFGPQVTLVINRSEKLWLLRALRTSQTVKVRWKSEDSVLTPWSEIGYTFDFQLNISPNILLGGNGALSFTERQFSLFSGTAFLRAVF